MIKIDIFSGFLGAGKTTLIKKLIKEAYAGEKIVLIENEFGEIGIDGGFLEDAGINITEMNSGCICCSLVGDFSKALTKVAKEYSPERIIIEPSGVGKLSDVVKAVSDAKVENAKINALCAVVDASKCKMYMKNFGEFFNDQVENASCIVLSHTDTTSEEKLATAVSLLREKNPTAGFITAPWHMLDGKTILARMEKEDCLKAELDRLQAEVEHHHEHEEECCCGHEHHHHEHHHHADEVFTSWGVETTRKYTKDELSKALSAFENEKYGKILRAKGIVAGENAWLHFDYVPGEADIREGKAIACGRLCVIGCELNEEEITKLFSL